MSQGIFGIIDFISEIESPYLLTPNMGAFLRKNGVNKEEISYICNHHYLFGMKRISNRSPNQQMEIVRNSNLQAVSLIHGEINNYQSLIGEHLPKNVDCQGDLDLAIHLYRRHGPQFAKKLNGLFSLAILDEGDSSFILLNDRFGMAHQVYWAAIGSRLYFATHLKTLLTLPEIKREIDPEALNLFLKYAYIPSSWTIFKGVKKLPAGHLLKFKKGKVEVTPYWEFPTSNNHVVDLQEAIFTYKELLKKSISRRIGDNGQVGILLSGGLDSSANVALAAECTNRKLKTFSVGFEDPTFDERPYSRIVAKHFNTQHFESTITGVEIEDLPKLIWHLEEPYFEFGLFLTYQGLTAARKEVDVLIGGEGADQLFGTGGFAGGRPAALHYLLKKYHLLALGTIASKIFRGPYFYDRDNLAFKFRMLWDRAIDLNNWYFYGYDQHELLKLYRDPKSAIIPRIFADSDSLYPSPQPSALSPQSSNIDVDTQSSDTQSFSFADFYLETQINQDLKHYVNENVMVKSGRMADMLDLTLRETYLDTEVTDFLVSLDYSLKRSGDLFDHLRGKIKTKFLHRKTIEGLLPPEIMTKPKQGGFVPVMIFLKNPELRKNLYHHLLNSEIIKEYFRIDYLKNLFENYERIQGKEIYWHNFYNSKANRILFLLTFDIWHHFYIKNNSLEVSPPSLNDYLRA
jgi:asparagine synthase (glutamine-hydrolysing)